jgi:hypothetical protein
MIPAIEPPSRLEPGAEVVLELEAAAVAVLVAVFFGQKWLADGRYLGMGNGKEQGGKDEMNIPDKLVVTVLTATAPPAAVLVTVNVWTPLAPPPPAEAQTPFP